MGISVASDIVLGRFAASAERLAVAAEAAAGRYGDQVLDARQAFVPDVLSMRTHFGGVAEGYRNLQLWAPEVISGLSNDLRDRMSTAIRAAEATSDLWHFERGTSTVTPFVELADAARGVAELAQASAPMARPVRVVVGGDGPAGLATANLLREAGAQVRVIAPNADARQGSVMIDRRGWDVLERAGAPNIARHAPIDHTGNYRMSAIHRIERELATRSQATGVELHRGREIAAIENLEDGVRVSIRDPHAPDHVQHMDADWYVDATGGRSPIGTSETFRRDPFTGTYGALPAERTFIAASAKAVPDRGLGWTAPDGSFAINDVQEGVVTAYRGLDGVTSPVAVSTEEATALLRQLDVDPTTMLGEPWSFTSRQTLARSAGEGRVLIVGDGAGTVLPVTQAGVFLALTDAERAAKTIIGARAATREAIADAVAAYDEQSRAARSGGVLQSGSDELLEQVADDASEVATEATKRATRTHDEQTRAMHRIFLG